MNHRRLICLIFSTCLLYCSAAKSAEPKLTVAGIPPVAYLTERIGGERWKVETLMQPGQDPHTYEPTPKQVQTLGRAGVFLKVGMPFEERLIEKIRSVRENIVVVDTTTGIKKLCMESDACRDHDHAAHSNAHHDEADYDPHVWLSPPNLKIQAANIAAALEKADATNAADYRANLEKLDAEIDALHEKLTQQLKPFAGRPIYVFHPAFGYFADCYGLKQTAIQLGGKQPSLKQLRQLVHQAEADKVKTIFIQPQFDPHSAESVAQAIGGKAVTLNDMSKDVLANLEEIAEKVERHVGANQ